MLKLEKLKFWMLFATYGYTLYFILLGKNLMLFSIIIGIILFGLPLLITLFDYLRVLKEVDKISRQSIHYDDDIGYIKYKNHEIGIISTKPVNYNWYSLNTGSKNVINIYQEPVDSGTIRLNTIDNDLSLKIAKNFKKGKYKDKIKLITNVILEPSTKIQDNKKVIKRVYVCGNCAGAVHPDDERCEYCGHYFEKKKKKR